MADHIQSWMISWEVFRVRSLQVVIGLFLAGIEEKSLAIKQAKGAFRWAHVEQLEIQKRGSGVCVCMCFTEPQVPKFYQATSTIAAYFHIDAALLNSSVSSTSVRYQ